MNFKQLVASISEQTGLPSSQVTHVSRLVLDKLASTLEEGGRFQSPRLVLSSVKKGRGSESSRSDSSACFGRVRTKPQASPQSDTPFTSLITRIRTEKLTYLSSRKLHSIAATCSQLESDGVVGLFVEAGCALGGSSILIASCKADKRIFNVYDVFGMIPPPTHEDPPEVHDRYKRIVEGASRGIGGDTYYGYQQNLRDIVMRNMYSYGLDPVAQQINLIEGLVQDTMNLGTSIAFAHIDVDWYEPVRVCLQRIFPLLSKGGSIILDDYHNWGGCRKAVDEFIVQHADRLNADKSQGSMKLTRTS